MGVAADSGGFEEDKWSTMRSELQETGSALLKLTVFLYSLTSYGLFIVCMLITRTSYNFVIYPE